MCSITCAAKYRSTKICADDRQYNLEPAIHHNTKTMKFLELSRLTIEFQTIFAVEWDLSMHDGRKTTVIYSNLPGVSPFQIYSDNPKYEDDKALLMTALAETLTIATQEPTEEQGTPLVVLNLSVHIYNVLSRKGINTAEKLEVVSDFELMDINGLGLASVKQIRQKLKIWRNANKK